LSDFKVVLNDFDKVVKKSQVEINIGVIKVVFLSEKGDYQLKWEIVVSDGYFLDVGESLSH
jgi:hypothetical protein